MARVRLDGPTFKAIPWHDAPIREIQIEQADDGLVQVMVRCELHPDEPRDILKALDIHAARLDIYFRDA
jgi:hypothetical protein